MYDLCAGVWGYRLEVCGSASHGAYREECQADSADYGGMPVWMRDRGVWGVLLSDRKEL